ncbi:phosphate signaling complex protein PhoU (plasmid) [Ralstonia pickettii]|uniref:phosphate signaling complex protein PhoU n=1 Tax=Ralstonia TaxID=48736 RepID=UPI002714ED2C|nr:phosphate signaling complex protein PhoU [Ralstonia pickettii]WKZ88722.1 phosphate signaling complex protein PhoU [Ralstonia pickettii]
MSDKHFSSQYDSELSELSGKLLEMGGLVEAQLARAVDLLAQYEPRLVDEVLANEKTVNAMEVAMDQAISNVIARRQPAARDLRLLMALSKSTTNLERAGDEARKIAKKARRIAEDGPEHAINIAEIKLAAEQASRMLYRALNAFARLDAAAAAQVIRDDLAIDNEFRTFVRKLITYMMEDARAIAVGLDYLFIAKAIERIGDHATNIAELAVFVARGTDVRHISLEDLAREISDPDN